MSGAKIGQNAVDALPELGRPLFGYILANLAMIQQASPQDYLQVVKAIGQEMGMRLASEAPKPALPQGIHPEHAAYVLHLIEGGEWQLHRYPPNEALTDEANRERAWGVERLAPPFCDKKGQRFWFGETALEACFAGQQALGMAPWTKQGLKRFLVQFQDSDRLFETNDHEKAQECAGKHEAENGRDTANVHDRAYDYVSQASIDRHGFPGVNHA